MKHAPSQFTVNQLKTSLSELMEVKDFHTISVNELCTSAGISRSTFYRDFSSVTDIRDMLFDDFCSHVLTINGHKLLPSQFSAPKASLPVFNYIKTRPNYFRALLKNTSSRPLLHRYAQHIIEFSGCETDKYFLDLFISLTCTWLDAGCFESPNDIAILFSNLANTILRDKKKLLQNTDQCSRFKPSMFNHTVTNGNDLIIFNSYSGIDNLCIVRAENVSKVSKWLEPHFLGRPNDPDFDKLIHRGIFVSEEVDEKLRREDLFEEICGNRNLALVIYPTNDCNFRCKYCALDFCKENITSQTKKGIIAFIRKNIHRYDSVVLSWFGGEPTLRISDIREISAEVKNICAIARKPFSAAITTNGYLLSPKNMQTLLDCNVFTYTVTIDGTKETHDKQRVLSDGSGTYNTIINNLLWIKNNIHTNALNVIIRTNITKEILALEKKYYREFDRMFGDDRRFSLFVRPAADWGGERVKEMYSSLIPSDELRDAYKQLFSHTGNLTFSRNIEDLDIATSTCPAVFKNKFTIGVNGDVYKCDDAHESLKIGHLFEDGRMELEKDKRLLWERGYRKNKPECDNCFYSCSCFFGVCPKAVLFGKDGHCISSDIEIDEVIRYASKRLTGVETI
ncbi:MAG: radical SAM protein [Clostridia bacterium]|nr:radical SAM protein [Clostridia bacterium]